MRVLRARKIVALIELMEKDIMIGIRTPVAPPDFACSISGAQLVLMRLRGSVDDEWMAVAISGRMKREILYDLENRPLVVNPGLLVF